MKSMTRPAKWIAICCVILGVSVVVVASRVSPPRRGAIALNLEDPGVPREIGGGLDAMMEVSAGWFIMGSDGGAITRSRGVGFTWTPSTSTNIR